MYIKTIVCKYVNDKMDIMKMLQKKNNKIRKSKQAITKKEFLLKNKKKTN